MNGKYKEKRRNEIMSEILDTINQIKGACECGMHHDTYRMFAVDGTVLPRKSILRGRGGEEGLIPLPFRIPLSEYE